MSLIDRLVRRIASRDRAPGAATLAPLAPLAPQADADPAAAIGLAGALARSGDATAATRVLEETIALYPESAPAYLELARLNRAAGQLDDAADCFRLAIHYGNAEPAGYLGLASLLKQTGHPEQAIETYLEGRDRVPGCANLATCLALAQFAAGRVEQALSASEDAIALDPNLALAWHNRGYLRLQLGDAALAKSDFERALALGPGVPATEACLAHALRDLGRFDRARELYEDVIRHDPGCADAVANLATMELLLGHYRRGWALYERRFGEMPAATARGVRHPAWQGESLAARTILVYAEQGLGDEIMFASCLPELIAGAGGCVLECNERLAGLFARSFPRVLVHGGRKSDGFGWLASAPRIDCQTPIGSLPQFLRSRDAAFPSHRGYLRADPDRVREYREALGKRARGPWIGISWRGGSLASRGRIRSIPLALLLSGLGPAIGGLVSLQHGPASERDDEAVGAALVRFPGVPDDIDRLAALIGALDLVITVDNTNVHVAGALGAPVWVLLSFVPEWRYGVERDSMVWYPSAHLFRQPRPGAWDDVVAALRVALASRYGDRPAHG